MRTHGWSVAGGWANVSAVRWVTGLRSLQAGPAVVGSFAWANAIARLTLSAAYWVCMQCAGSYWLLLSATRLAAIPVDPGLGCGAML